MSIEGATREPLPYISFARGSSVLDGSLLKSDQESKSSGPDSTRLSREFCPKQSLLCPCLMDMSIILDKPFQGLFVISSSSLGTDATTVYPRATASLSSRNNQSRAQIHSRSNRTQAPQRGCRSSHLTFRERQVWHPRRDLGSLHLRRGRRRGSLWSAIRRIR